MGNGISGSLNSAWEVYHDTTMRVLPFGDCSVFGAAIGVARAVRAKISGKHSFLP